MGKIESSLPVAGSSESDAEKDSPERHPKASERKIVPQQSRKDMERKTSALLVLKLEKKENSSSS